MNRLGQFIHGLCLPFHLARLLLADGSTRWRYLTVSLAQVATIVVLWVLFTGSGREVVETIGPGDWSEEQVQEARAEAEEALLEAEEARESWRAAKEAGQRRKRIVRRVVYWAALLSSLQIAQWIVIALSRDYHTVLSREASLLTGLAPEDEPLTPRVRLNTRWLRNRLKRRWRGVVVFSLGVPLLWSVKALFLWGVDGQKLLSWGGDGFFNALLFAWGAWWFVVFTAGKSALAWSEPAPREPWFLRGWGWLTARAMPLRPVMGSYGALWTRFTRPVFAPAASVERRPWSLVGLAVVRLFASLPLVKCFLRPVIPVAASHLLVAAAAGPGEGSVSPPPSAPEPGAAAAAPPPRPPAAPRTT